MIDRDGLLWSGVKHNSSANNPVFNIYIFTSCHVWQTWGGGLERPVPFSSLPPVLYSSFSVGKAGWDLPLICSTPAAWSMKEMEKRRGWKVVLPIPFSQLPVGQDWKSCATSPVCLRGRQQLSPSSLAKHLVTWGVQGGIQLREKNQHSFLAHASSWPCLK